MFATDPIKKGELLAEYRGRRITTAQAEKLEAKGARYIYELNKDWSIDGSNRRNLARYGNHSCRPNAESDIVKGKILIRAIRNIRPGTEITYHYGEDYLANVLTRRGCKCIPCMRKRARKQAEWRRKRKSKLAAAARRQAAAAGKAATSIEKKTTAARKPAAARSTSVNSRSAKSTTRMSASTARRASTRQATSPNGSVRPRKTSALPSKAAAAQKKAAVKRSPARKGSR